MAKTYPNGVVSPEPGDQLPASGAGAWDLVAASADAQLGDRYTKAQADALLAGKAASSHTHPISGVTGLQAALNGKTDTTDPRLSDARTPTAHTHELGDVAGLAARLAALEYDSGPRDITALFSEVTRGKITAHRRGDHVSLNFYDIQIGEWTSGAVITLAARLPAGLRPPSGAFQAFAATSTARGAHWVRVLPGGDIAIYYIDNTTRLNGSTSYFTPDPAPAIPPGSVA